MTSVSSSSSSFSERFERELKRRAERRFEGLGDHALLSLAVCPVWTESMAEGVLPPFRDETIRGLDDAEQVGLVTSEMGSRQSTEARRYWMPDDLRDEVVQRYLRSERHGFVALQRDTASLAAGLRKTDLGPLPDSVRRFAALAHHAEDITAMGRELVVAVRAALSDEAPGEALSWIETAEPLERWFGGEISAAVQRSSRLIELYHVDREDKRALRHFKVRREQVDAFDRLLDGDDTWALHYVGVGGVGKTMLTRHMRHVLVKKHGGAIARIDFDFINPDYPARAPGLLLAQFAEELAVHDRSGEATSHFEELQEQVLRIHERFTKSTDMPPTPLDVASPEFQAMLRQFANGVAALPRPVVLVLDTCEELARIKVDGTIPDNVRATFDLLEALHEIVPSVRVVFCGRRPLASRGAGWRCDDSNHPERPYLLLHEIRGFTETEAQEYVADFVTTRAARAAKESAMSKSKPAALDVSADLRDAAIVASRDTDEIRRFAFDEPSASPPGVADVRYNPFHLNVYAMWIVDDPSVDPDDLRVDRTHYVDMRILGRIRHDALRDLVPYATLLGRFDRTLLEAAVDGPVADDLFEELGRQEWISRQAGGRLEVDRKLRGEIEAWYHERESSALSVVRGHLADRLRPVLLTQSFGELDVSTVVAHARCLVGRDEAEALAWWAAFEDRFVREGAWDWAEAATERLIVDEEDGVEISLGFEVAILLTHGAARRHRDRPAFDVYRRATSLSVGLEAEGDEVDSRRLAARAALGVWATVDTMSESLTQEDVAWSIIGDATFDPAAERPWNIVEQHDFHPSLAPMACAALENLVELAERGKAPFDGKMFAERADWKQWFEWSEALRETDVELAAFLRSLFARAVLLPSPMGVTANPIQGGSALKLVDVDAVDIGPTRSDWADWVPPTNLGARLRLEYVRIARLAHSPPGEILEAIGEAAAEEVTDVDTDRLTSARFELSAALAPISHEVFYADRSFEPGTLPRGRESNVHRAFRPYFCAYYEEAAANGEVAYALEGLSEAFTTAEESAVRLDLVHAAESARLRIVARWRLRDEGRSEKSALESERELNPAARMLLDFIDAHDATAWKEVVARVVEDGRLSDEWFDRHSHLDYRSLNLVRASLEIKAAAGKLPRLERTVDGFARAVDRLEPALATGSLTFAVAKNSVERITREFRNTAMSRASASPEWRIRLACRLWALAMAGGYSSGSSTASDFGTDYRDVIHTVGVRRVARIEHEEAEALALRFPRAAVVLFERTALRYAKVDDLFGEFLARGAQAIHADGARPDVVRASFRRVFDRIVERADLLMPTSTRFDDGVSDVTNVHPTWRPWMMRAAILNLRATKEAPSDGDLCRLRDWVEENYGKRPRAGSRGVSGNSKIRDRLTDERPYAVALPYEPAILFAPPWTTSPSTGAVPVTPREDSPRSETDEVEDDEWDGEVSHVDSDGSRAVVAKLVMIAVAGGGLLWMARRLSEASSSSPGVSATFMERGAIVVGWIVFALVVLSIFRRELLVPLALGVRWLARRVVAIGSRIAREFATEVTFRVEVRSDCPEIVVGETDPDTPIDLELRITAVGMMPIQVLRRMAYRRLGERSPGVIVGARVPLEECLTAETLTRALANDAPAGWSSLRRWAIRFRRRVRMEIRLPSETGLIPWEAVLVGLLFDGRLLVGRRLSLYRMDRTAGSSPDGIAAVELVSHDEAITPMVLGEWTRARVPVVVEQEATPTLRAGVRAVHVVGNPIQTASGLRLSLGGRGRDSRRELVDLTELVVHRSEAIGVCLLQPSLAGGKVVRTSPTGLRQLADGLATRVPVVITLPPLRREEIESVLGLLIHGLGRPRASRRFDRAVIAAVDTMREVLLHRDTEEDPRQEKWRAWSGVVYVLEDPFHQ